MPGNIGSINNYTNRPSTQDAFNAGLDRWVNSFPPNRRNDPGIIARSIKDAYANQDNTRLHLYGSVTELPKELWQLTHLTELDIAGVYVSHLPEEIGQLTNLQILTIGRNRLQQLPENVCTLSNLRELYAFNNYITELPSNIGQLSNLEILHLADNRLTELPESIRHLTQLKTLDLSQNRQLQTLPDGLTQLPNLQALDLSSTDLIFQPENVDHIPKLTLYGYREVAKPTITDEINFAQQNMLDFAGEKGIKKLQLLVQRACQSIQNDDANWPAQNSIFINQLLHQVTTLPNDEQGSSIKNQAEALREVYLTSPHVQVFSDQADDMGLAPAYSESFIFVTPDGQQGLSVAKACYEKNILSQAINHPNADWKNGVFVHQAGNADPAAFSDPETQLTPFPLLYTQYKKADMQGAVNRLFITLNMGDYQQKFLNAMNIKPTEKMVEEPYSSALKTIFDPLITNLGDEPIITDTHFAQLLDDFRARDNTPEEQAAILLSLSTLFVKYSSSSIFGTEYDSPMPLRSYAAALLIKATQIFPGLLTAEERTNYRNRMLGLEAAFSCTDILTQIMISKIKNGSVAMRTAFERVIPQLWR